MVLYPVLNFWNYCGVEQLVARMVHIHGVAGSSPVPANGDYMKKWFIRTFCKKEILLEQILKELKNIHFHIDQIIKPVAEDESKNKKKTD